MAITRRELLGQLEGLIRAEVKVMSTSGVVSGPEVDIEGFTEEFEEDVPGPLGQPSPSSNPFGAPFQRR
jgi:hypothetical protein